MEQGAIAHTFLMTASDKGTGQNLFLTQNLNRTTAASSLPIPGAVLALLKPETEIGKCLSLLSPFFFILRVRKLKVF